MAKISPANWRPPSLIEVQIYFEQKGISKEEAFVFYQFQERRHWKSKKGNPFLNWKGLAYKRICKVRKMHPLLFDKDAM